jgi:hypothetical protein
MKSQPLLLLLAASSALAQGTFQNLDFESVQLVPIPGNIYGAVEWSYALPAWTGYIGGQVQNQVIPNGVPLGTFPPPYGWIALTAAPLASPLQGQYGIEMGEGVDNSGNIIPVSISQTGLIPSGVKSLRFLAGLQFYPAVLVGSQQLPVVQLGGGPYSWAALYGVDISAYQGSLQTLSFAHGGYFDDITFSPMAIPEPSVLTLAALGTLLLTWRFLRQTHS